MSLSTETMMGLIPTGTVATTWPKLAASTGLVGSQLGLLGRTVEEQSGTVMMDTDPGVVPVPRSSTTSSSRLLAISAHTGWTPTGILLIFASRALVWVLMTDTVLSP